jgi:hypothetical protein
MNASVLTAAAILSLAVCACSKKSEPASARADASPAAVTAAANASQVTSIPGYTPEGGNAAAVKAR